MRLSMEWKYRLNFLLAIYRKQQNLTQKDVYYNTEADKWFISPVTINKVEHGKTYVNEHTLPKIYQKIGIPVCISLSLDEALEKEIQKLYDLMEKDEIDRACISMEELLHLIEKYNVCAYYHECFYFFKILHNYYKKKIYLKEEDYEKLFQLVPLFPNYIKEILLDFLYIYASGSTQETLLNLLNTYDFSNSKYLPNQINYANQLYENGKKLRAYTHLIKIEPKANRLGSTSQLAYLYVILSSIALKIDEDLCRKYLKKMENMLDDYDKNKITNGMLLINLANRYILLNEYESVKKFTEAYRQLHKNWHIAHNIIKLCYSARMLNETIDVNWFKQPIDMNDDKLNIMLYQYYENIDGGIEKNMKFLMKRVKPHLTEYDQTYVKIVCDELYLLSNQSGSYISYIRFIEEFKSIIFA